jgi:hypothetical protein
MIFALSIFIAYGPRMEPVMAVVLALCIFLGALLPLLAHYIDYLQAKLFLREQEAAVPETIKDLTEHFEKLLHRVEEAAADVARTTLTARQIPTQLQSSTETIDKSKDALKDALSGIKKLPTSDSIETLIQQLESKESPAVDFSPITTRLDALEAQVDKGLLVREDKLEEMIEQLQQFEEALDTLSESLQAPVELSSEQPKEAVEVVESNPPPAQKKKRAAKVKKAPTPSPQADLFTAGGDETPLSDDSTTILVKAMVGLPNEVFARGDEPLNWDEGTALKLVGIGEWLLEVKELTSPIEVQLRLNDEVAANGPSLNLEPGQRLTASPDFPGEVEPF